MGLNYETKQCKCGCGTKITTRLKEGKEYASAYCELNRPNPSLERRECKCGCGRVFKVLPSSKEQYGSIYCAMESRQLVKGMFGEIQSLEAMKARKGQGSYVGV